MLINIFINDLDDGIESAFTQFADDTKLGGEVDMSEERATSQRDLDRLGEWASKNSMRFNKSRCQVPHLDGRTGYGLCGWGTALLKGTWGDLVGSKLNMSQQGAAAATKANWTLGCIHRGITSKDRDVIIPLYSVLDRPHLQYCVQLWFPELKKDTDWRGSKEGLEDDQKSREPVL
ncbi:mitochondrial enolase superfamily member 1 [Grus japonensis]|uniref:Mitochondrial enolase superfamily member 1 n=1 Tax=Grus japonensis TaxID=30415 RepID=A0ABC9X2I9_GRUJA